MEWIRLIYSAVLPQVTHAGTRAAVAAGGALGCTGRKQNANQRAGHPPLRLLGWSRGEAFSSVAGKSMPEGKGSRPGMTHNRDRHKKC